jgi:hypothetical protein
MVGHESKVTPWNPGRGRDWAVVETPVRVEGRFGNLHLSLHIRQLCAYVISHISSFQLSFAEPASHSLYLPHQFSLHADIFRQHNHEMGNVVTRRSAICPEDDASIKAANR